jgi:hypothetical protein
MREGNPLKSRLSLKKETLAELTSDELRKVMGGAGDSESCTSCFCSCHDHSCNLDALAPAFDQLAQHVAVNC